LVTSWAQYKAFTSHAEKFNKAPEDVVAKGGEESVKVTHGGPGTHGAGGGGSGGGVIGAGGAGGTGNGNGAANEHDKSNGSAAGTGGKVDTRQSDIVDGHPKDYGRYRDSDGLGIKQGIRDQYHKGMAKTVHQSQEDEGVDAGDKERRIPSGGEHGFHEWEIEEMEELLKEVRGTLGKLSFCVIVHRHSCVVMCDLSYSDVLDTVSRS
jgi:phospholipase D1/2